MADSPFRFADTLSEYVDRSGYTPGQLAGLAQLPKTTLVNWLEGRVRRPREWQPLLRLATALHLTAAETSALLAAAGHPTLQELRVLAAAEDRELLAPWPAGGGSERERAPFQAVADLPYFSGRDALLDDLKEALLSGRHASVYSLQGMAGAGKTALAAHLAYRLRPHFPDGVLWARLDASDTMSILSTFARAYGQDVSEYADLASRSRVVRDLLRDKRALIVLDDARRSADVEPLLPPTGPCAVIITTRRHDLAVASGAQRFAVPPFQAQEEALALFAHMLGEEVVAADEATFAEIADHLGHLPLALAIAVARLAYEPGWSPAGFLARVRQKQRRLQELTYEDRNLRLSFRLSYEALAPTGQRFFAALGVVAGEDFDATAAAAVADVEQEDAEDRLRRLYSLSLVQQPRPGRYQLHPLLRDYARDRLDDGGAWQRMVAHYVAYAERQAADYAALEREQSNVLAALEMAPGRDLHALFLRGVPAVTPFLQARGLYDLAAEHLAQADAVARARDDDALVRVLRQRAQVARRQRHYAEAEELVAEGLALARAGDAERHVSAFLAERGTLAACQGDYAGAESYLEEGLALARQGGYDDVHLGLLREMGAVAAFHDDVARAEALYREGLALAQAGDRDEDVIALRRSLGAALVAQGDLEGAEAQYRGALALARALGHRAGVATLLNNLGSLALRRGDPAGSLPILEEGLAVAGAGEHVARSMLHKNLGDAAQQQGEATAAERHYREGLALAEAIGHVETRIVLHRSLGRFARSQERFEEAATHLAAALALAQDIGHRRFIRTVREEQARLDQAQEQT